MQFNPSVPTADVGFFPDVLGSLAQKINEMHDGMTTQQQLVAVAVATVFVAVISALDSIIHSVCFVVKIPFVAVKALLGAVSDLDQYMPGAFDAKDWLEHARKVYACVVMFVNAVFVGAYDPECVLLMGRRFNLLRQQRNDEETPRGTPEVEKP